MNDDERRARAAELIEDPRYRMKVLTAAARTRRSDFGTPPAIVMGIFFDAEPPGTVDGRCFSCDDPIRVGPNGQQVMRDNPARLFRTLCSPCCVGVMAALGGDFDVRQASEVLPPWARR